MMKEGGRHIRQYDALCDRPNLKRGDPEECRLIVAEASTCPAAISVRTQSDQKSITDGPFVETKEQLAGFSDQRQT
jgi:hypothetical protein